MPSLRVGRLTGEQRRAEAKDRTVDPDRRVKAIQQKFDRLDHAFLFA